MIADKYERLKLIQKKKHDKMKKLNRKYQLENIQY